ncbi:uncharacterized protein [Typha angustifolia]|uniref:uncharacterized protein isoform X2 n=1 Tax=Typha angustifolia TaxID=59011 RepID=UPI003C2E7FC6
MEKNEPAFKPEWLKSANGCAPSNASSNHHASISALSDDHGIGNSFKNRLSVDRERNLSSSSSRRNSSLNSSRSHDKDISGKSRAYSSFGRSNREREREKDFDFRGRESRPAFVDNGFHDSDPLIASRFERDNLRPSRSMVSGRPVDTWHKGQGLNSNAGILSRGSIIGASFEKDFPSLGNEEKNGRPDVGRVSSPEVPAVIGAKRSSLSPVSQSVPISQAAAASSSATGLNMAETVAQSPSRVRAAPQLSVDTQRIDELTLRQCKQLIPMTPPMPKNSVSSSSEKLKNKGTRGGDSGGTPKSMQQSSSQPLSPAFRAPVRSDTVKPSQMGSFQVLNREKNGLSPTTRDGPGFRVVSPVGPAPSASTLPFKSPTNQKPKVDTKGTMLSSPHSPFGEKRLHSQAKERHEFFNYLRNKTSSSSSSSPEPSGVSSSYGLVSVGQEAFSVNHEMDDHKLSTSGSKCSENGNCLTENIDACEQSESLLPETEDINLSSEPDDPEEEALLGLLGWDKNEKIEALTKEEIDAFKMKYEERIQSLKLERVQSPKLSQ